MDEYLRKQIYNELSLRETDDLIKIWQERNLAEFEEATFEIIREILLARLGYVPPQFVEVQFEDLLNRIEGNLLAENLDQALGDCESAIQIAPNRAETYNYRGVIYDRRGDLARASSDFQKALQLDPSLEAAQYNLDAVKKEIEQQVLGRVEQSLQSGEYDKALADCQLAIQLAPDLAAAYNYRGVVYDELGKLMDAIADYQKALRLDPELEDAQENLEIAEQEVEEDFLKSASKSHLDQALVLLDDEQNEAALAECELARQTIPPISTAHNALGMILQEAGELEGAIAEYQEAVLLNPRFYEARENLGNALFQLEEEQYQPSTSDTSFGVDDEETLTSDPFVPLSESVYCNGDSIPGWIYLDDRAFLLTGWAGHRTRPGRTGYDPLDSDFELAHMEGVVLHLLLTRRFRTHNPFYLLFMIFLGLLYCMPLLFLGFALLDGELGLMLIALLYVPYVIAGMALLINVILSLSTRKPVEAIENGNSFF